MWVMAAVATALLAIRFYLRLIRQKSRLHASDYILLSTFLMILSETAVGTVFNVDEIRYLKGHPVFPHGVDVLAGYSDEMQTRHLKVLSLIRYTTKKADG